tara:strand:+ start:492 stop:725 length:234 start_codon:yes stop_codon:yes gene_type:complete
MKLLTLGAILQTKAGIAVWLQASNSDHGEMPDNAKSPYHDRLGVVFRGVCLNRTPLDDFHSERLDFSLAALLLARFR